MQPPHDMEDESRLLCVSLHDVAPSTLDHCLRTLEFLDDLRVGPVALLVVPHYHGSARIDHDDRFCEFLRGRERRGDEIVLHGFWHQDKAAPARGVGEWLERRVLTDREGEFARLEHSVARSRILRGLAVLRAAAWQPRGFVAPAWLMSPGTREALETLPFEYCATRDAVLPLPAGSPIHAPSFVMSIRSGWRRKLSVPWNRLRLDRRRDLRVLRVALHPCDIAYQDIARSWRELLVRLSDRSMCTEADLVARRFNPRDRAS